MTTRSAIIVGSPGSGDSKLTGVEADVNGYATFLRSDAGGAWNDSEVTVLINPTREVLLAALAKRSSYTATIFAGHGECRNGEDMIWINDSQLVPVATFRTYATRQLTIIDACRAVTVTRSDMTEAVQKMAASRDAGYRQRCRSTYEAGVAAAEEGRSIMWSCSLGQAAGENPSGGYFSEQLLARSSEWATSHRRHGVESLDVVGAFSAAAKVVRERYFPQNPKLENGRRMRSFPFAVA